MKEHYSRTKSMQEAINIAQNQKILVKKKKKLAFKLVW